MGILTQTFGGSPGGMNTAFPQQEIDDSEARYIQDALLDYPGLIRRRGPVRVVAGVTALPRKGTGLVGTINPAGDDRYAALTGDGSNGYFTAFSSDLTSTVDLSWPHALPTDPVGAASTAYRLVDTKPAVAGGSWVGVASSYGAGSPNEGLALWRGGTKADYTTGTLTLTRGSATVTGSGTSWVDDIVPGMFLFANTDDASAGTFTATYIGCVLSVNSATSITLEKVSPYTRSAGGTYTLTSLRGFIPRVRKGAITTDTASTTVSGGGTRFKQQGLETGTWNLYRARDLVWIGKVTSIQSDLSLTLTANAAVAMADEEFVAIRGDWSTAEKGVDITAATNKVGWINAVYAERQFYLNNGSQFDKTYRLHYSEAGDAEGVDLSENGDWIPIESTADVPESGRGLMPTYNALLIFKETETFALYGTSPDSFSVKKLEDDGALSTMSIQPFGGGAVWAGREGIQYYDGVQVRNLTQAKLGDVWKNTVRTMDNTRYRAYAMVVRNHYILHLESLSPTVGVTKGNTTDTPTSWVVVVNMDSLAVTMATNIDVRGSIQLPANRGRVTWYLANSDLATPSDLAGTASTTGGTLATGTYYYKVTALNTWGETTGSSELSKAVTGPTGSVALTWTAVDGASSYRIYRGTSSGAQNVYYTATTNAYTDTNAASTMGSVPSSDSTSKGIVCDSTALFDEEGIDTFGCDGKPLGPDFYYESKKFNAGDDVRLKRFKQIGLHYLIQGDDLQVDTVLGLNNVGRTLVSTFPESGYTWDTLRTALGVWDDVADEFATWNDIVQSVFQPRRVRFLKKTHHLSFRLWQASADVTRCRIGPFAIGYKLMRPGRV